MQFFYLFTIQRLDNGEEGRNYEFEIRDLRIENKSPKSGWKRFSDDLMNTGIINLKDESEFPDIQTPHDAYFMIVEIGTPKKYRIYNYPELAMNNKILEGPGKLDEALKLIEKEFNYKRPCQQEGEIDD